MLKSNKNVFLLPVAVVVIKEILLELIKLALYSIV